MICDVLNSKAQNFRTNNIRYNYIYKDVIVLDFKQRQFELVKERGKISNICRYLIIGRVASEIIT